MNNPFRDCRSKVNITGLLGDLSTNKQHCKLSQIQLFLRLWRNRKCHVATLQIIRFQLNTHCRRRGWWYHVPHFSYVCMRVYVYAYVCACPCLCMFVYIHVCTGRCRCRAVIFCLRSLLALCEGNTLDTGTPTGYTNKGQWRWALIFWSAPQIRRRYFETPLRSLCRHCNDLREINTSLWSSVTLLAKAVYGRNILTVYMRVQRVVSWKFIGSFTPHFSNTNISRVDICWLVLPWDRDLLLAYCEGNTPVNGGFPSRRPVTRSSDVLFALRLKYDWANSRDAGDVWDAIALMMTSL